MKKHIVRAFALLLAVIMAAGAFACKKDKSGSDSDKEKKTDDQLIVGKWEANINLASMMMEELNKPDAEGQLTNVKLNDAFFKLELELKNDGTYGIKGDAAPAMDSIIKDIAPLMKQNLVEQLGETGAQEMLALLGISDWETFAKTMLDITDMSIDETGEYKFENGKMSFTADNEEEGTKPAVNCTVTNDELKLAPEDGKAFGDIPASFFPLVFKRVG